MYLRAYSAASDLSEMRTKIVCLRKTCTAMPRMRKSALHLSEEKDHRDQTFRQAQT